MVDKLTAHNRISELVNRFEEQFDSYKNAGYNETQTRRDFIDPFFKALGWDIDNSAGYAESYREVIHEDKVKISGATKAPDYSFRLVGGKRLFFVEAKKPSISIKEDIQPAYQVRRYGWSAKHPISIITDFEEFGVYDCTKKPDPYDKPSVARVKYFTYRDYLKEFDFIWGTFSKEQVLKGSFDKFIQSDSNKKGTATVDKEFLESLDRWRTYLAVNISWNNKNLDEDEINFAVQQTIDRIIFLRIAEDRSVEPYGNLKHSLSHGNFYGNLFEQFIRADEKYNSGLFDLKKDKISGNLIIENKVIKTLINELYYPECPYEFSVLPVEILGFAYEQFLGKVIRITPAHHAKIEEKPEVRKAGGVYYTPQYIVDYIVKNTVGKIIAGKTPKEISKIKIVDPACGSGSFLIGAYQYLLDYHREHYSTNGNISKGKKESPFTPDGNLTTAEKKKILLNNIFGVDIDVNAVEVTKLSLLLKCLEGETEASIQQQLRLWNERVLPTLENNIKCGNSLIDTDIYAGEIDFGTEKKIKPFSWHRTFPETMNNGGFDVIIGNPPWGANLSDDELAYLRVKHNSIIVRMVDSYLYFINHSIQILRSDGSFGMIIPSTFLNQYDMHLIRKLIVESYEPQIIINLGEKVFGPKVLNTSTVLIFKKSHGKEGWIAIGDIRNIDPDMKRLVLEKIIPIDKKEWIDIVQADPLSTYFTFNISHISLFNKLKSKFIPFKKLLLGEIQRGISPDYAKAFVVSNEDATRKKIEKEILRPVVLGKHISRYKKVASDDFIIYLTSKDNINNYPNAKAHLEGFKKFITCREVAEGKHPWFALHRPRNPMIFLNKKFIGLTTTKKITLALDDGNYFTTDALYVFKTQPEINEKVILAVMQSNVFHFLYNVAIQGGQRVIPQVKAVYLNDLPFPVNADKCIDQESSNEIIKFVDELVKLAEVKQLARFQNETDQIQGHIDYCEDKINKLVCELYELNNEEIKIVQNAESFYV